MEGLRTVEAPSHQLLDYQEYDDSSDIILHRYWSSSAAEQKKQVGLRLTYVVAILDVEESPEAASN